MRRLVSTAVTLCFSLIACGQAAKPKPHMQTPNILSGANCTISGGGWPTLKPGGAQVVFWNETGPARTYRFITQPASSPGLVVYVDSTKFAVPSAPSSIDLQGDIMVLKNETSSERSGCFDAVVPQVTALAKPRKKYSSTTNAITSGAGFLCQSGGVGWFTLAPGSSQVIYHGTQPGWYRIAVQPAISYAGMFVNVDAEPLSVPSAPSAIDVQGNSIVVRSAANVPLSGCYTSVGTVTGTPEQLNRKPKHSPTEKMEK
jgi:hypothetical protein